MARKKKEEVIVQNEEVVEAEDIKVVEDVAPAAPAEKTQLDYIMDVLNEEREANESHSCIWNGIEIKVKRYLNIYEMKVLFDEIFNRCFSTENGAYQPEYRDFADRAATIAIYTDITLPSAVDDQYDLVYKTDLYFFVTDHIDPMQHGCIMQAIDEKLEEVAKYRADDTIKKAEEAITAVESLTSAFGSMFDDVDPDSLANVIKSISEHGIDEKAIVDAVIDKNNKAK